MWITFYYISTVDISVIYICFLYCIRYFFRSGQNHKFILCSIFFIVQKCHVFIEYDIFSGFSLWGIFYIFLVYFYSEILLMLSPHTIYLIFPLPKQKIIKNLSENFSVISPFYHQTPSSSSIKITLIHQKSIHQHHQPSHKSTVFSESNHFLIIMHSFSHSFLSKSNSHT